MASYIGRRKFLGTLGGAAAAWPLAARAQATKVARIGYLHLAPASARSSQVEALRAGLRNLGYVEGKSIVIEFRWAESVEQLRDLAAELVRMNVDIIVAASSTMVEPARQATRTIPIVFYAHADPVGIGHVASLARPGGNATGLSTIRTDLAAKELELLKQAVPHATKIGVLWNPTTPSQPPVLREFEAARGKLAVQLHMVPAATVEEFEGAFASMTRESVGGFVAVASPLTNSQSARLAELALKHRLPGMFGGKGDVEAGGLMSYGPDINDLARRAAIYIDKILKGAKPAELPVEQASRYRLVINLTTAKALGLQFPDKLLALADEVIE